MIFNLTQPLISSIPVLGKDFTWSGSDGTCLVIDDGGGNWRIKFLSSGRFTPLKAMTIDAFLVGGGGGGGRGESGSSSKIMASGGGGGRTRTIKNTSLLANKSYVMVVGAGGDANADGGNTYIQSYDGSVTFCSGGRAGAFVRDFARPSASGAIAVGGAGGSGGGSAGVDFNTQKIAAASAGGDDGNDGETLNGVITGGAGQGRTTREFGEPDGALYAGGGGAFAAYGATTMSKPGTGGGKHTADATDNTGGGGGGSWNPNTTSRGGSGIIIIRNTRR